MIPNNYQKKSLLFPFLCAIAIVVFCVGCSLFLSQKTEPLVPLAEQEHKEWKDYGGGPDHSKYVEMTQITKANVKNLPFATEGFCFMKNKR